MEYKQIDGYENYYINACGKVLTNRNKKELRTLKHRKLKNGYYYVTLINDNNYKNFYIHRLVASTFIDKIPIGFEVNHIDGDKSNNDVNNLEIITHKHNMKHYYGYEVERKIICDDRYILITPIGDKLYFKFIQDACKYASSLGASHVSLQNHKKSKGYKIKINGDVNGGL